MSIKREGRKATSQQAATRSLVSATGGRADNVSGTTTKEVIVPNGLLSRDAFSITTEAGGPEITDGNEAGAASDAYPLNEAFKNTCRGAFDGGDDVFAARYLVDGTAVPAEDVVWDSPVNGHAVPSRS